MISIRKKWRYRIKPYMRTRNPFRKKRLPWSTMPNYADLYQGMTHEQIRHDAWK